jgi:hypothetical protein
MIFSRKWILGAILLSLLPLFTFFSLLPRTTATAPPQGNLLGYLPMVVSQHQPRGIYGRVTENNMIISNVTINLRLHDGLDWTTVATTTTNANGEYYFLDMPALAPDHIYNILYVNPENDPDRVISWIGYLITDYAAGADALGADIDIADIPPANPPSGAVVGLPATFTWHPRPIPTDSYEFELFAAGGVPYFYSNPALGYVNNYTLTALPPGFQYNTPYFWSLVAYGPGGGGETGNYGFARWSREVTFVKTAGGLQLVTSANSPARNHLTDNQAMAK